MAAPGTVDAYLASRPSCADGAWPTACSARRRWPCTAPGLSERALDRLLGLVTEAALTVRGP